MRNPAGWKAFLNVCLQTKNEKELSQLLDLFLTHEEKEDLATRFLIIHELVKEKKTQRTISKDLNVSIAKITRGSNALKHIQKQVIDFLRKNTHS